MNDYMVEKWNSVVNEDDTVYFLGDLTFGRGRRPHKYWLDKLNGDIIFIKGSHDDGCLSEILHFSDLIINCGDMEILLVHDPVDIPSDWNGWVMHGHHHNNSLEKYPLIHAENKRINVSVELIDYTPISIDGIISMMEHGFTKVLYRKSPPMPMSDLCRAIAQQSE